MSDNSQPPAPEPTLAEQVKGLSAKPAPAPRPALGVASADDEAKAWAEIAVIGKIITCLANWTIRILLIVCLAWWLADRMEFEHAKEKAKAAQFQR